MLKRALKSRVGYEEKKPFSAIVVFARHRDCCARRMDCCTRRNNNVFQEGPASGSCVEASRVQTALATWVERGAKCNASVCFLLFLSEAYKRPILFCVCVILSNQRRKLLGIFEEGLLSLDGEISLVEGSKD